jgi:hypothetical protein
MTENLSLERRVSTNSNCPECGSPLGADQCCWVCVARYEDIEQTLTFSLLVGMFGMIAAVFALGSYPPIGPCWWVVFTITGLFVIPGVITYELYDYDLATRHATLVRLMLGLAATTIVLLVPYFLLNGFLDISPPVQTPALVLQKFINSGRYGDEHYLQLTWSWNGQKFEAEDVLVGRATYSVSQPGDYVRVLVHPGKFSLPWYSGVLPAVSRENDSR